MNTQARQRAAHNGKSERRLRTVLLLIGGALAAPAAADSVPSFTAQYLIKRNNITLGENTRSLAHTTNGYIYTSVTQSKGIFSWFIRDRVEERSVWEYRGEQLRPTEYVYERNGGKRDRRIILHFDWEQNVVTNDIDGDRWRMSVPPDTQDKLIYQLSMMIDLEAGREQLQYNVADGGKLKNYEFSVLGKERVTTRLGEFNTIKIQRVDDKRRTTVWCAPDLLYLPVLLEQTEKDGSELSMHIERVQGLPKPQ